MERQLQRVQKENGTLQRKVQNLLKPVPTPAPNPSDHNSTEDMSNVLTLLRQLTVALSKPSHTRSGMDPTINATAGQSSEAYAFAPVRPYADPHDLEAFLQWRAERRRWTNCCHTRSGAAAPDLSTPQCGTKFGAFSVAPMAGLSAQPLLSTSTKSSNAKPHPLQPQLSKPGTSTAGSDSGGGRPEDGPPPGAAADELDRLYPKHHYPDLR